MVRVLITGGVDSTGKALASAEVYDPVTGTFSPTGNMAEARAGHTDSRLSNGLVLVAGGFGVGGALASAELFNPATGTFSAAADVPRSR